MITLEGKKVYSDLSELVEPAHTALLLIDMQCDFIEADGAFGQMGIDLSMYAQSRPRLRQLLASARDNAVLVVHVQNTAMPRRLSDSPSQIRFNLRMHAAARGDGEPLRYTIPGTRGHQIVPDLAPESDELIVPKYRSSAFWGTNLDLLLRSNGIETVVVTGGSTEGCVESTARDAMFTNYYVVIAEDCVASDDHAQHDASMLLMRHRFDMADSTEIATVWAAAPDNQPAAAGA